MTTSNWHIPDVALQPGVNIITVTAQSVDGSEVTDTLMIAHNPSAPAVEWSIQDVVLQPGVNVITVRAHDGAGNTTEETRTVTYITDTTPPTLTIESPEASELEVPVGLITLKGTAADDVGVTAITWTNDRGGSGVAVIA